MRIRFKLYANLSDYLPDDAVGHAVELDVPEGTSPHAIIDRFHVPRRLTHLVLVNGIYADKPRRDEAVLKDGDTLAVWPPIAGG